MRLGFDPELFLVNQSGKFIASVGLIGGTKENPDDIGEGCAVQEDNVAVEFNTPPCSNPEEVIKYFDYAKAKILERVQGLGLELKIVASANFDEDQLASEEAQTFGCDPDYSAWTYLQNPRPESVDKSLRSAGGHIHVETELDIIQVVRAMDVYVGAWLSQRDPDKRRRELYGNCGAFRQKSYGVEYRTPSNYWLSSNELIRKTWNQVEKAVKFVEGGGTVSDEWFPSVCSAVDAGDKYDYEKLNKEFKIE